MVQECERRVRFAILSGHAHNREGPVDTHDCVSEEPEFHRRSDILKRLRQLLNEVVAELCRLDDEVNGNALRDVVVRELCWTPVALERRKQVQATLNDDACAEAACCAHSERRCTEARLRSDLCTRVFLQDQPLWIGIRLSDPSERPFSDEIICHAFLYQLAHLATPPQQRRVVPLAQQASTDSEHAPKWRFLRRDERFRRTLRLCMHAAVGPCRRLFGVDVLCDDHESLYACCDEHYAEPNFCAYKAVAEGQAVRMTSLRLNVSVDPSLSSSGKRKGGKKGKKGKQQRRGGRPMRRLIVAPAQALVSVAALCSFLTKELRLTAPEKLVLRRTHARVGVEDVMTLRKDDAVTLAPAPVEAASGASDDE